MTDHLVRTVLAVVAVAGGTALVAGVMITSTSITTAVGQYNDSLRGIASFRVLGSTSHGGLDQSVLPAVRDTPGVASAAPLVATVTEAADGRGGTRLVPALGIDCAFDVIVPIANCADGPIGSSAGGPLVGRRFADWLGPSGEIRHNLGATPGADVANLDLLDTLNEGFIAVYELPRAQELFTRPNGLDAILVVAAPGADLTELRHDLETRAGPTSRVLSADEGTAGAGVVAQLVVPLLGVLGLVGLLIGAQLVRNTVELSLEDRRRELATLGALGQPPRRLTIGLLAEGACIGLTGGLLGVLFGVGIAGAFVGRLSDQMERITGLRIPVHLSMAPFAIAVTIGTATCVAASFVPARRAVRRELAAELSGRAAFEPERSPRLGTRLSAGLAVAALLLGWLGQRQGALLGWQPMALLASLAAAAVVSFRAAGQLTLPLLDRLATTRTFGTGPRRIAINNLKGVPGRTSAIATAIGAPIIVAAVTGGLSPGIGQAAADYARDGSHGRVFVSTLESNNTTEIDAKVPPGVERAIASLPQVDRIEHWYGVMLTDPTVGQIPITAYDGTAPDFPLYGGQQPQDALAAGHALAGPGLARRLHLEPGSRLTIAGRYGPVTVEIGSIWASLDGLGSGLAMSWDLMQQITGPQPAQRLQVVPAPGTTPPELAEQLRTLHLDDRLIVLDPDQLSADYRDEFVAIASPFTTLHQGLLAVALTATTSTLLLAAAQRRRDHGLLTALGLSPRARARSTLTEVALLSSAAALIACVASQLLARTFTWASGVTTGLNIPWTIDPPALATAAATATLVALVGAVIPAWQADRTDPITALREG